MKWQYVVIIIVVVNIIWYNYQLRKKRGLLLDMWLFNHYSSWLWYFLIYPFADSVMNYGAVGNSLWNIRKGLPMAFNVVCVGYVSLWIGKLLFDRSHRIRYKKRMHRLGKMVWSVFAHKNSRLLYIIFHIPVVIYVLYIGFQYLGNDIRQIMGTNGLLRPIMNLVMGAYPAITTVYLLIYLQTRKKNYLYISIILICLSVLLSSRRVVFSSIVSVLLYYSIFKGRKVQIYKVVIIGLSLFIGVIALAYFRSGNIEGFGIASIASDFLYGNTFSDIRDFAWVLGYWNGELLLGKTYVAGILSFIPSTFSNFRQEWSIGNFTLNTTGLLTEEVFHGGLRCSIFGESFFNFGFGGVILISVIYGYLFEKVNCSIIAYCRKGLLLKAFSSSSLLIILDSMLISAGSFRIYSFFIPIIVIYYFFYVFSTK